MSTNAARIKLYVYVPVCLEALRSRLHKVNVTAVTDAPVTEEGSKGARIKWLINEKDGAPTFLMRHFTVEAGGFTPFHNHHWEHEVYILEGRGKVRYEDREEAIQPGDAVLIPPDKKHQFRAGAETLKFICIVPK
ncbi:MAG TPA: cupin domain-containing protein [Candidatus Acidoferrales bacterium]|nr:cupin domain-containing protein [Candidatus Acidoferrales bacterium]